jgi:hypothetical protein
MKLHSIVYSTDVPSMFSQLKTYIISIAKNGEKSEPQLRGELKDLKRKDLPDYFPQENIPLLFYN